MNRNPDIDEDAKALLCKTMYKHFETTRPSLFETIKNLIDGGQTPNQIMKSAKLQCPKYSRTPKNVWLAAMHYRIIKSQPSLFGGL